MSKPILLTYSNKLGRMVEVRAGDLAGTVEVTAKSPLSGKLNTRVMPATDEAIRAWVVGGGLIQERLPDLNGADREFLMTGYTPEDWEAMFPPEER